MWRLIYNLLIHAAFPFFLAFALTRRKLRANLRERVFPKVPSPSRQGAFWVHAASVGEAAIAESLIGFLKETTRLSSFLVTTNTFYTRDLLARKHPDLDVASLPFDLPFSLSRFLGGRRPSALVIIETEIWPNLIWAARKRRIPVVIINGRISDRTVRTYRRLAFFFKQVFASLDAVLAQSEEHAARFREVGMAPERVVSTGNIKYYRKIENVTIPLHQQYSITFGSIRENELDIIVSTIDRIHKLFPGAVIFVAPRELHLVGIIEERLRPSMSVTRYSNLRDIAGSQPGAVVVDTVGDLLSIYARSAVAFVGGSLAPFGGHNILEPLFFGTPVLFGPHTANFQEIADAILDEGAGMRVSDEDELCAAIQGLLNDEDRRKAMGDAGTRIIERQRVVMEETAASILRLMRRAEPSGGGMRP